MQSPVEVKRVLAEDKPVVLKQSSSSPTTGAKAASSSSSSTSTSTMTINQTIVFDVPAPPLFETFTDERR